MTRAGALHPRGRRVPSAYPRRFEREVMLADGRTVNLRPIVPADIDELRRAVAEGDPQTLHDRLLGGRPPQTDEEFTKLVTVDYDRRFAMVALTPDRHGVGVARYEASPGGRSAEVAVAVDPQWRHVGLATALLRLLGEAALGNGITRLTAEFLRANVDVGALLADARLPIVVRLEDEVAVAEIDLTAAIGEVVREAEPAG